MNGIVLPQSARDTARFLRAWLSSPLSVAAVAPSGRALARLMTAEVGPHTGPVIELGPGTGVFTRALLSRGIAPGNLLLVERSPEFTSLLRQRFAGVEVVCDLAQALDRHAAGRLPARAGAVVSGLPFVAMSAAVQGEILGAAFRALAPGGAFIQFTYGHVLPVSKTVMRNLDLQGACIGRTLRNLPPASVYSIRRKADKMSARTGAA